MLKFASKGAVERRALNLNQVLRDAMPLVENSAARFQAVIELRLAETLPEVDVIAAECVQVLINLVQNAMDANAKHITLCTESDENFVYLRVRDDGAGIPPEQIPKLCDPFFTTRGYTGGTGLGLSIVHRIVTDSHGTIAVESEPRAGTTVTIRFPRSSAAGDNG
jgi:signal transduction histidine kinase